MRMKKLAVFDLDNTIISVDSFIELVRYMIVKFPAKIVHLPYLSLVTLLKFANLVTFDHFKSRWLVFFKGMTDKQLESISKKFMSEVLVKKIKPGVLDAINYYKTNGFTLVLATASFEFYVRYFSDHLGFDHLFATRTSVEKKGSVLSIDGTNCKGIEKINRITGVINPADIDIASSAGFSDSKSDLHYLQIAGTFSLVDRKKWKILKVYNK
jgi:phosphatidylglycerophosphatase C